MQIDQSYADDSHDPHHLSADQFRELGVSKVAYVKPVKLKTGPAIAIHGADGTPIALAGDLDLAIGSILHHDMTPAFVH